MKRTAHGYLRGNVFSLCRATSTSVDWFASPIQFAESGRTSTTGLVSMSGGLLALGRKGGGGLEGLVSPGSQTQFTLVENGAM
jgi:hypothetical protein